ncbi:hypothetical protein F4806DRAFT_474549, partial [Annulohypoxylon nitens]
MPRYLQIWAQKGRYVRIFLRSHGSFLSLRPRRLRSRSRELCVMYGAFFLFTSPSPIPAGSAGCAPSCLVGGGGRYAVCYAIHGCCCSEGRFSFLFYLFFLALQLLLLIFQKHIV